MKKGAIFTCIAALVAFSSVAMAYKQDTHERLSVEAIAISQLQRDPDLLNRLGVKSTDKFKNTSDKDRNIIELISDGAKFEDNFPRSLNHFFDPLDDTGLGGGFYGMASPDWALEDKQDIEGQLYSYEDVREYLYRALTSTDLETHDLEFGLTFQTLGQVIHHIQDMAQPQHVRDDVHCDIPLCKALPGAYNPSRYEKYTDDQRQNGKLTYDGYSVVNGQTDTNFLTTARSFWHTEDKNPKAGKGIAEFTNANFLSAGTNYDTLRYPSPRFEDATPWEDRNINQRLESVGVAVPSECLPPNQPCTMVFFRAPVTDNYRPGASGINDYTSTLSIFDQDLKVNDKGFTVTDAETGETRVIKDMFALNRFNFDAAYKFLIPRAVAYSAGFINYFFRGRLGVSEASFSGDGSGVSVSLRVKNDIDPSATPAWKDEDIFAVGANGSSTFVLTAQYELGGSRNFIASSPVKLDPSKDEVIKPGETSNQTLTFTLPPIPANATKVEFRLVFRGKLGQEEGAVAVGMGNPIAGFAVSPNYIPSDGIGGTRAIFKRGNSWVLGPQQQVLAGNIDWKGAYVGDRPTKVLSWRGPRGRYFGTSDDRFGYEIYQHGRLWAVTPIPVLGAAVTKDASGKEWVVAICQDGTTDVVYRRPNTESASSALYDPDAAPEGWQQLGSFTQDPTVYLEANSPWFFNGNGTEAQTMRPLASKIPNQADRLKITVTNAASASIVNLGNLPGIHVVDECEADFIQEGDMQPRQVSSHFSESRSGSYVVAVDYLNMTERLAQYSVEGSASSESAISDSSTIASKAENSFVLTLSVGDSTVTLTTDERAASESTVPEAYHREETFTTRDVAPYSMDLRYGLVAIQNQEVDNGVVVIDAAGLPLVGTKTETTGASKVEAKVTSKLGSDVQVFLHADPPSRVVTDRFSTPTGVDCIGNSTHESTYYIYIFNADVFDGTWLVDSNRNLFGTQTYTDYYHSSSGVFSYISGGNLDQIIPPGSSASLYYPAGVIR